MTINKVVLEVVVCTVDDARRACDAGADRLELVSAISEGGLTPSLGTFRQVRRYCDIPIVTMIRSRGGGFTYSDYEWESMEEDAKVFADEGTDALVTGCLTDAGLIDEPNLKTFLEIAGNIPVVFHRAFDLCLDYESSLRTLSQLGVRRILTGGGHQIAIDGVDNLALWRQKFPIEILAGGGIRERNAAEIVRRSSVDQIHLGPFHPFDDPWATDHPIRGMSSHLILDANAVKAVREELDRAART
jgi:copper homeostasis protein